MHHVQFIVNGEALRFQTERIWQLVVVSLRETLIDPVIQERTYKTVPGHITASGGGGILR